MIEFDINILSPKRHKRRKLKFNERKRLMEFLKYVVSFICMLIAVLLLAIVVRGKLRGDLILNVMRIIMALVLYWFASFLVENLE